MLVRSLALIALLIFVSKSAWAELMFNPAKLKPKGGFSAYFLASEVSYEGESGGDFDIERKIIGGDYTMPLSRDMDFVVQGGLIFDAEVESSSSDGQGLQFGAGGRMRLHATREVRLIGFGLINYLTESYDGSTDPKLSVVDLHAGATALFPISPTIQPFAGLELALFSDGEIDSDLGEVDVERDDFILINLGLLVPLTDSEFFFELTIGGEQTLTFGMNF